MLVWRLCGAETSSREKFSRASRSSDVRDATRFEYSKEEEILSDRSGRRASVGLSNDARTHQFLPWLSCYRFFPPKFTMQPRFKERKRRVPGDERISLIRESINGPSSVLSRLDNVFIKWYRCNSPNGQSEGVERCKADEDIRGSGRPAFHCPKSALGLQASAAAVGPCCHCRRRRNRVSAALPRRLEVGQ